jgi:hypothetical protein
MHSYAILVIVSTATVQSGRHWGLKIIGKVD